MTDMASCTPAEIARTDEAGLRRILPILPLYLLIFIGFCGYSLMITLFAPMLMGNHGFLPDGATVGQRSIVLGLLLAIYPLGQFVGSPVLGAFSDRYGRRPVLVNSLAVTVLGYAVIALGIEWQSLALLGMGCLIGGLAESNIAIAQSAISDMSSPDERPRLFAWTYSSSSLGYIAGPILGGQMALHVGWSFPFWLMVPLLAATLLWIGFRFTETHVPAKGAKLSMLSAMTNLSSVFTDKPVRRLYLLNFLIYLALFGYFRMVLVYLVDRWQAGVNQTTFIYSGLALISAITSFVVMAPLTRKVGLGRLALVACLLAGLAMIAITVPTHIGSIWITAGLTTMMGTIALAACPTILSNAASAEAQGRVLGNNQALQVGAESLSAMMGGAMAAIATQLPLLVFGVFLIVCGMLLHLANPTPCESPGRSVKTLDVAEKTGS